MAQSKSTFLTSIIKLLSYHPPRENTFVLPESDPFEQKKKKLAREWYPRSNKRQTTEDTFGETIKSPQRIQNNDSVKASETISPSIQVNLKKIKREFNVPQNKDIIMRPFTINGMIDAFIVYIDNMVDRHSINISVLRPLMNTQLTVNDNQVISLKVLSERALTANQTVFTQQYNHVIQNVLNGQTALFVDGDNSALLIETRGYEKRNIEKPATEATVRGSLEGFTESVNTNISQIRRIIKNKNLIHEYMTIGETSNTSVSILYLKNVANPAVVKEVKRRLSSIKTDALGGNGFTEQYIEDHPFAIFPQTLTTERPDRTAFNILEGRVAILTDGAPYSMIVPVTVQSMFQTSEDYHLRWIYATPLRFIRFLSYFLTLLIPAIYLAVTNYHHEVIPTDLIIAISRDREGVPFPTIVEILLMDLSWELIREAGIRVPGVIGTTLGIIGALILGQAAVAAKIVSPIMVIIVAVTGLGNFAIPNYNFAFGLRVLRFFFLAFSGVAGFYGIAVAMVIVAGLAASMKSFGVPYLTPSWPRTTSSPDILIRDPIWRQELRPDSINPLKRRKQPKLSRGWVKGSPPSGYRE
ncbi:spore germination protein [Heliobacillus mobilis]|uniref:Spore germination protein n=1 Tax=Heliobacterium mobile TaxID=28064 RepID=A0A6I3SH64_HELMO|nr:spore germination protein [Heliobacterium mobile]MTV48193.1 spore germination protein [Heliobacterium mobile]